MKMAKNMSGGRDEGRDEGRDGDRGGIFYPDYYVYTDGACSNNGRENALAGIGIYFGIDDPRNLSEKIDGKQTNNTAELSAIIKTFQIIENDIVNGKNIMIMSDSIYAIKCATSYGKKCNDKGWNITIPNKELVKIVYELYKDKSNVKFTHIKAHTKNTDIHSIGNAFADKLANIAIGLENCPFNVDTDINININTDVGVNVETRIYLKVFFCDKDKIKKLGGLWDRNTKKWYVNSGNKNINEILTIFPKE